MRELENDAVEKRQLSRPGLEHRLPILFPTTLLIMIIVLEFKTMALVNLVNQNYWNIDRLKSFQILQERTQLLQMMLSKALLP